MVSRCAKTAVVCLLLAVALFSSNATAFSVHSPTLQRRSYDSNSLTLTNKPAKFSSSSSVLFYRAHDADDDESSLIKVQTRVPLGFDTKKALVDKSPNSAMNKPLIRVLYINQALILGLAVVVSAVLLLGTQGPGAFGNLNDILNWTGGEGPGIFDLVPTADRMLLGLAGALPMLVFANIIENSDNRAFSTINFSTIAMVMTLFGRRKAPPKDFIPEQYKGQPMVTSKSSDVLLQSFLLSGTTGFCEEIVFRRLVPSIIAQFTGGNLATVYVGQAALFGLGHMNPKSNKVDNGITASLQAINGLVLGGLYIATDDLVPCIIAHGVFDFVEFFKTWRDANAQLEYAERMYLKPLPAGVESRVRSMLDASKSKNPRMNPRLFDFVKRLFYVFDFDKSQTLSLSEVRKGISYMALEQSARPPDQTMVDQLFAETIKSRQTTFTGGGTSSAAGRLDFTDFVRLWAKLAQRSKSTPTSTNNPNTTLDAQA
jgi:membrane protease YdiL (CAAX protease family)